MSEWFRYERDFASRWCPVVFHDGKPKPSDRATAAIEVPADCLASDGSPMFGRLQAIFPPPPEEE